MSTTKIAIGVLPNLWPVIQWLEGGCDPKEAAKELRLYAERIDQGGAPVIASAAPAPVVPADSRDQALGLYVAQAEAICALLDKHAPDTHGNLQTRLAQALTRGSRIDADKLHRDIGYDGSSVRPGPNHSTIEIWYDTEAQAHAARRVILDLTEAAQVAARPVEANLSAISAPNAEKSAEIALATALAKGYGGSTCFSDDDGAKLCIYYPKREDGEAAHDALARAMDARALDSSRGGEHE